MSQYLGNISAYAYAQATGQLPDGMTEEEYAELMASYATVGQTAVTAAQTATTKASEAATSATTATNKASEATTAAQTATTKAAEAQADADAAALDASQALSAASTATTKATEATTAAATAVSAKDDAVSANTAAQSAKTAAQTAQTGAETAAASVQSSAEQIATNTEDIGELKNTLSDVKEKINDSRIEKPYRMIYRRTGFFTFDNDAIGFTNNAYYQIWECPIVPNREITVRTYKPIWSNSNRVVVITTSEKASYFSNTYINRITVDHSELESANATDLFAEYTITPSSDAKYMYVIQSFAYITPPDVIGYNKTEKEKITFTDFLEQAKSRTDLTVADNAVTVTPATFSITMFKNNTVNATPYVLEIECDYETTGSVPYITAKFDDFTMPDFILYSKKASFRIPIFREDFERLNILISKPSSVANFKIKNFSLEPEKTLHSKIPYTGITLNAHLGYYEYAPENTLIGFECAIQNGYNSIICNPKKTTDGKWVCIHDTTINRTGRNADGSTISETLNVADLTYEQLLTYDFGYYFNPIYAGTKIPLLTDILKLCAVTGTEIIYSLHSAVPINEIINELLPLTKRYGMLEKLILKGSLSMLKQISQTYGNKILCYDIVVGNGSAVASLIETLETEMEFTKNEIMIDVPIASLTTSIVESIVNEGYRCGAYDIGNQGLRKYKSFIDAGCTEFTDDANPHNGLWWY